MINVCVQGLGYVGATTAVLLAGIEKNKIPLFKVYGIEVNTKHGKERIKYLKNNIFPFKSNDKQIIKNFKIIKKNKNLIPTLDKKKLSKADIVIVSIGLDLSKNKKKFNDKNFKKGILDLGENIEEKTLIIVQSTVPIGYTRKTIYPIIKDKFQKRGLNYKNIKLAHSYERVTPGSDYINSIKNSHRVYSGISKKSKKECLSFLKKFIAYKKFPITELDNTEESEFAKILENSYRTTNIAFIEEWRKFSEYLNLDLERIIKTIRLRKTHSNIMMPGLGVGGYCLTKDPKFGELSSKIIFNKNFKFPISTNAININREILKFNKKKIINILKLNNLERAKIIIFGLTYKEDVDDLRNSPSLSLATSLNKKGFNISYYDNFISEKIANIKKVKNINDLRKYDLIIFSVKHNNIKNINFKNIKISKKTIIYDSNLVLTPKQTIILKRKVINFHRVGQN